MSIIIELNATTEAILARQAESAGLSMEEFAAKIVEQFASGEFFSPPQYDAQAADNSSQSQIGLEDNPADSKILGEMLRQSIATGQIDGETQAAKEAYTPLPYAIQKYVSAQDAVDAESSGSDLDEIIRRMQEKT
jgi:hypothetical protein